MRAFLSSIVLVFIGSHIVAQTTVVSVEQRLKEACMRQDQAGISKAAVELAGMAAYGADKLEYALNLLQSVEQNGILITGGAGDTYPLITLQQVRAIRPDVIVVQTAWLDDTAYAVWIQQAYHVHGAPVEMIKQWSATYPVYVSLAAPTMILQALEEDLYCTGLAFKVSSVPIANVKVLHRQWWKNCAKNALTSGLPMNANYLMPLGLLAGYMVETGKKNELKEIKKVYAEIAKSVGEKEQIPGVK
ncbi:MAG: hypothetical protein ACK478_06695 [Flavobacteriales bacterium]|jgi:hypothetical protein